MPCPDANLFLFMEMLGLKSNQAVDFFENDGVTDDRLDGGGLGRGNRKNQEKKAAKEAFE